MNVALQSVVALTKNLVAIALPLALISALAQRRARDTAAPWARRGAVLGMCGALAVAILSRTTAILEREIYDLWVLAGAATAQVVLLVLLARKRGGSADRVAGPAVATVSAALVLQRGPDGRADAARPFRVGSLTYSTETVLIVLGILAALAVALVVGAALRRVALAVGPRLLLTVTVVVFAIMTGYQVLIVTQVSLARGLLPMDPALLAIVVPLINRQDGFLYAELAVSAILPIRLLLIRRPAQAASRENPAQHRKLKAGLRSRRRWCSTAATGVMGMLLALPVGTAYGNREVRLSPAVPVAPVEGVVSITLETLEDGHLHRFAFSASDGTEVRFIAIRKSTASYAAALDACQICGATGYYERKGQVVCKLCDVVMNKATIGFRGGCNPIPIVFRLDPGAITIDTGELESRREIFQ